MPPLRNDTAEPFWIEGLQTETGVPLVLDDQSDDVVFVRQADPGDDASARVCLNPGQRIEVMSPVGVVSICVSDEPGADDAVFWLRVVPDGRANGFVYGRTLRRGELDDGRRVHVRPGETFQLPAGSVLIEVDAIEDFYRELDPSRPHGSIATVVRVWNAIRAIEPPELARIAQAAAHRIDAATHLLFVATPIGESLRNEPELGGPRLVAAIDEYVHLVQEAIVALARCVALTDRAQEIVSFETAVHSAIEEHRAALKDLRDSYEHIDERAFGRARREEDDRNLMIFDHATLVREGTLRYHDHLLAVEDLHRVVAACRALIKELIGGPTNNAA